MRDLVQLVRLLRDVFRPRCRARQHAVMYGEMRHMRCLLPRGHEGPHIRNTELGFDVVRWG